MCHYSHANIIITAIYSSMRKLFYKLKLKTKLIILIFLVFVLAVVAENIFIIHIVNNQYYNDASKTVEKVADIVAGALEVVYDIEHPTLENLAKIQTYAEHARALSQVEFITIFDMHGIRYSHPDKNKIGLMIAGGDGERAMHGESYLSVAQGTLGSSVRAFRPIYSEDHRQIGAVLVGQTLQKIDHIASRTVSPIVLALVLSLMIAILLALWLSRNIKNILFGLEPFEMVKLFEERDAIIHTVKEGIVVINRQGEITQINAEAKRILKADSRKKLIGQNIYSLIPNTRLYDIMQTGESEYDTEQNIEGITILTNRIPLIVNGQLIGAVATFRDMTEMRVLAENLTGVHRYADALRSQSHEFHNKLHVIYGLVFNDNRSELINYLEALMGNNQIESDSIDLMVKDTILAGFLKSKFSRARELDVELNFSMQGVLVPLNNTSKIHCLVTILGNLIDNSLDAVQVVEEKRIYVELSVDEKFFTITVKDSGHGIVPEMMNKIFAKGYSTKGNNRGFGLFLALASINELGGTITTNMDAEKQDRNNNQRGAFFRVTLPICALYQENLND